MESQLERSVDDGQPGPAIIAIPVTGDEFVQAYSRRLCPGHLIAAVLGWQLGSDFQPVGYTRLSPSRVRCVHQAGLLVSVRAFPIYRYRGDYAKMNITCQQERCE